VLLALRPSEAVLDGEEPDGVSLEKLHRVPVEREAQRRGWGWRLLPPGCSNPRRIATVTDVHFGRREQMLARREPLQIRALVARREHYRPSVRNQVSEEPGTPGAWFPKRADSPRYCQR
jgi:hypothetical protein